MLGRTDAVHVSDCIRYICLRRGDYPDRESNLEQMQLGSAIEHAVASRYALHFPDEYIQLRELERDNIYGNPDLVHVPRWACGEIKLTWMSMRHAWDSLQYDRYWMQLKSYLKMLDSLSGWLEVFYARGNFKDLMVGYRKWDRQFTRYEVDTNWDTMLATRDIILEERLVNKTRGSYD
jgi:hypothetical protein